MPNRIPSNSSPLGQYQALVNSNQITFDASQQLAINLLQQLYSALLLEKVSKNNRNITVKGVYLWGKVGRGKTFLMDLFVQSLLAKKVCKRQHFHHFMQDIHQQLKVNAGKPDPLKRIAQQFSRQYRVLCFDEFFVSDIGDAMLLGNLLQYLFELNIVVVATSNCAPQQLYRNGLQRDRFLPAIAAIEKNTQTLHLNGDNDHRHRALTYRQNYFELPYSAKAQLSLHQELLKQFTDKYQLKSQTASMNALGQKISILGREIPYIAKHIEEETRMICFDFSALCQGPRSHFDYIELAKRFNIILLFNVPPLSGQAYERIKARGTEDNGSNINVSAGQTGEREVILAPMDDAVRRFIALVDECYDSQVSLLLTAFIPQDKLYESGALMFEFERTKSRLIEMASKEYFAKTAILAN
ncbi:cell division protein ZapE [Colwelliaceae bacterium 6441]